MQQFTAKDLEQIKAKGISPEKVEDQITNFRNGFPFADLVKPATPNDGIEILDEKEIQGLISYYDTTSPSRKIIKFVPASGAASRMFKALFEFIEAAQGSDQKTLLNEDRGFNSPWNFITHIQKFAFFSDLNQVLAEKGSSIEKEMNAGNYSAIIQALVASEGLDYGNLPKGLLKFHTYKQSSRVALEEHLVEAAGYATSNNRTAYVHFTVSQEHMGKFQQKVEEVRPFYEKQFGIQYDISFSVQKPSTDTVAVDMNNEPFREPDGSILFRPGGHGALIENLGDLQADLIFIKNIDNVVPDRLKATTRDFKKVLGGLLLKLQEKTFNYLKILDEGNPGSETLSEMAAFAVDQLKIVFFEEFDSLNEEDRIVMLKNILNRPMRICGMVKNEGEPGGGPFWVRNSKGVVSLQVVESSQIDHNNPQQAGLVTDATHFNPVDLVCATKDYKGNRFDLHDFIDPLTGFISEKSKNGRDLKALELPGLWNGAMADWITLFVEVPIITFNPVKTVNDLLREQHQPE